MNSGPSVRRSGIAAIATIFALYSCAAVAQLPPGVVGQPLPRDERLDQRSPAAREAENYDPRGVQVGSFTLFPDLELDEVYNDNLYPTSAATGRQGTFIELIRPTLQLRSDWNNHMLDLFGRAGVGLYSVDSSLNNFQDVSVGGNGRIDIQRNWNVYGGASWNRSHEERGTPNTVTANGLPVTVYNLASGNAGYFQKFNRLGIRLDGRLDNFNYFDSGLGPAQGVIPNSDRNRNEWREAARLGYELVTGYEVWVRGSLNQRTCFQFDSSGLDRGSYGFDVVGGVLIDLGGITALKLFAGYLQQSYVSGQFASVSAPTFGLTGYWNPMRELWIKPFICRSVDNSALTTSASYISTTGGVDVSYDMRPNSGWTVMRTMPWRTTRRSQARQATVTIST